jgi:hypothetical protein
MPASIGTYNPALFFTSFGGSPLSGFADGTFVEIEQNTDDFEVTVGASGETVRTQSNNHSGKITLTLLQSALSNDTLNALYQADKLTGQNVQPFFAKELNGNTQVSAPNAWVKKAPTIKRGKEIAEVEWVIETDNVDIIAGSLTPL